MQSTFLKDLPYSLTHTLLPSMHMPHLCHAIFAVDKHPIIKYKGSARQYPVVSSKGLSHITVCKSNTMTVTRSCANAAAAADSMTHQSSARMLKVVQVSSPPMALPPLPPLPLLPLAMPPLPLLSPLFPLPPLALFLLLLPPLPPLPPIATLPLLP